MLFRAIRRRSIAPVNDRPRAALESIPTFLGDATHDGFAKRARRRADRQSATKDGAWPDARGLRKRTRRTVVLACARRRAHGAPLWRGVERRHAADAPGLRRGRRTSHVRHEPINAGRLSRSGDRADPPPSARMEAQSVCAAGNAVRRCAAARCGARRAPAGRRRRAGRWPTARAGRTAGAFRRPPARSWRWRTRRRVCASCRTRLHAPARRRRFRPRRCARHRAQALLQSASAAARAASRCGRTQEASLWRASAQADVAPDVPPWRLDAGNDPHDVFGGGIAHPGGVESGRARRRQAPARAPVPLRAVPPGARACRRAGRSGASGKRGRSRVKGGMAGRRSVPNRRNARAGPSAAERAPDPSDRSAWGRFRRRCTNQKGRPLSMA